MYRDVLSSQDEVILDKCNVMSITRSKSEPNFRYKMFLRKKKPSPHVSKCLTCPFLKQGQANYTFTSTKEKRRCIHDPLNCKSKNLIYLNECKKCGKQYIGETKRHLHQSFRDHRRSILNRRHFPKKSFSCIRTFQLSRSLYQRSPSPYSLRSVATATLLKRHAKLTSLTKL